LARGRRRAVVISICRPFAARQDSAAAGRDAERFSGSRRASSVSAPGGLRLVAQLGLAGAVVIQGEGLSPQVECRVRGLGGHPSWPEGDGAWGGSRSFAWGDSFAGGYARALVGGSGVRWVGAACPARTGVPFGVLDGLTPAYQSTRSRSKIADGPGRHPVRGPVKAGEALRGWAPPAVDQ
jgi:hypothetical protein